MMRKFTLDRLTETYKEAKMDQVIFLHPNASLDANQHERRIAKRRAETRKNRRCTEPRLKFIT